ncbi:unnamed protein product, partial [Polarella glacialis]
RDRGKDQRRPPAICHVSGGPPRHELHFNASVMLAGPQHIYTLCMGLDGEGTNHSFIDYLMPKLRLRGVNRVPLTEEL